MANVDEQERDGGPHEIMLMHILNHQNKDGVRQRHTHPFIGPNKEWQNQHDKGYESSRPLSTNCTSSTPKCLSATSQVEPLAGFVI